MVTMMSNVSESYRLGYTAGKTAAASAQIDLQSATLILLALVDHDPSVTVELPAPKVDDMEYTTGYVTGWSRRIIDRSHQMVG